MQGMGNLSWSDYDYDLRLNSDSMWSALLLRLTWGEEVNPNQICLITGRLSYMTYNPNESTLFLTVLIIFLAEVYENNQENQNVQSAASQLTCKICWEAVVGIIFLPCSHLVCCVQCSAAMTQCPVCRTGVAGTIKVNIWLILTLCQKSFRLHHEFYLVFRVNAVAHTAFMPLLVFFITVFLGCNCSNPWMHESRGGHDCVSGVLIYCNKSFLLYKLSLAKTKKKYCLHYTCITSISKYYLNWLHAHNSNWQHLWPACSFAS